MFGGFKKFLRRAAMLAAVIAGAYGGDRAYTVYTEDYAPTITVNTDYGGSIAGYVEKYERWRDAQRLVRINGLCISACTLALGVIDPEHLCATKFAKLAFHSAHIPGGFWGPEKFSSEGTRMAWYIYPPEIRAFLRDKHKWDAENPKLAEHPNLIYVEGSDVYKFVRPCS